MVEQDSPRKSIRIDRKFDTKLVGKAQLSRNSGDSRALLIY